MNDLPPSLAPEPPEQLSQKRRQMVDAAAELFMAHGYGAVSMDGVARAAGVSKATLYAHFTSKDQLFATIVGDAARRNADWATMFCVQDCDIRSALTIVGDRMLRFLLQPATLAIYRVAVAECARFPELGLAFMQNGPRAGFERLTAWLSERAMVNELVIDDPQVAAAQFMGLLKANLFMRASLALPPDPSEAEIEATVGSAIETFLRAFGAKAR